MDDLFNADEDRSLWRQFVGTIRRHFTGGILVVVPAVVTISVLYFLFLKIDGLLSPLLTKMLGYSIPGMGIAATVALILLAGLFTRNVFGSRVYALGELFFMRTPLVRAIYAAVKQLVEAFTRPQKKMFDQVVLIEYPREGIFALAFAAAEMTIDLGSEPDDYISVFVPTTPTPVSGFVVMVPKRSVTPVELSIEEAVKILMSGGIATPHAIRGKAVNHPSESKKELML